MVKLRFIRVFLPVAMLAMVVLWACSGGSNTVQKSAIAPTSPKAWNMTVGGKGADSIDAMVVDPAGNIVIGGVFGDDLTLGSETYTTKGSRDVYIAKLTSSGSVLWSTTYGSTQDDEISSLVVDAEGAIYVTGTFVETLEIGTDSLVSAGGADIYVAKFDAAGTYQWSKSYGGTGYDGSGHLAVTADNSVLLAAQFSNTLTLGSQTLTSAGLTDVFLARISSDGSSVSASSLGGKAAESVSGIGALIGGQTIVGGTYDGSLPLKGAALTSKGNGDVFLLKF